ncbi:MAG: hypothetical protein H7Z75_04175 [Ferruginibacter sp.]|nr:hypothetical protein [Cytophagales bacterium]
MLYRTFRRNPLYVWRWRDYAFHPRYQLPYLHPDDVLPRTDTIQQSQAERKP